MCNANSESMGKQWGVSKSMLSEDIQNELFFKFTYIVVYNIAFSSKFQWVGHSSFSEIPSFDQSNCLSKFRKTNYVIM